MDKTKSTSKKDIKETAGKFSKSFPIVGIGASAGGQDEKS